MGWGFGVHFSILARKLREKSLHRHRAIKWHVYKVWHLFFACSALLLGFHVKKTKKTTTTLLLKEAQPSWRLIALDFIFWRVPCGLQSGYSLTNSCDKCTLLCQKFSLSSLSKCAGWNASWFQMSPKAEQFFVRVTHAEWRFLAFTVYRWQIFWQGRLFLSAALADIQSASFSIL